MSRQWLAVVFVVAVSVACAEEDAESICHEGHEHEGTPSGAACNGSDLTYENFGQAFMQKYCTTCHSSELQGEEERHCAPSDHNFDTLDQILLYRDHIDEAAAAGPDAMNDAMPPSGLLPTDQERLDLGIWLACEEERMP